MLVATGTSTQLPEATVKAMAAAFASLPDVRFVWSIKQVCVYWGVFVWSSNLLVLLVHVPSPCTTHIPVLFSMHQLCLLVALVSVVCPAFSSVAAARCCAQESQSHLPEDYSPTNVLITTSWVPQTAVLGHPAVKAFLCHGGHTTTNEALATGTPMLCMPLGGDQLVVAQHIKDHGFGLQVCVGGGDGGWMWALFDAWLMLLKPGWDGAETRCLNASVHLSTVELSLTCSLSLSLDPALAKHIRRSAALYPHHRSASCATAQTQSQPRYANCWATQTLPPPQQLQAERCARAVVLL